MTAPAGSPAAADAAVPANEAPTDTATVPEVSVRSSTSGAPVVLERRGHVLLIGVNRAHKLNSWGLATIEGVAAGYQQLAEDPELRVGVVHGIGPNFSAGLDLAEVGPVVASKGPLALSGGYPFDPFGVWGPPVPKPVVMAVQGIAYTLSIELALASDIVVAASDVRFAQLEISRGIMPFGGGTFRAQASLGWGNAMRFLLTAEEFGAEEALRIGLVQAVVEPGEQLAEAVRIAELIAAQAPLGVQATLANSRVARSSGPEAAVEHLAGQLQRIITSSDAEEGVMSFIERRPAKFTGK